MPIARFEMPDGKVGRFEVPDGTTPDDAQRLIQDHLSSQKKDTSLSEDVGTVGRQFSQGVTAGFGDELKSFTAALTAAGLNKLSSNPVDTTMGQFYDQAMADEQNAMNKDMENSPYLSMGANLAGGLVTGKAAAGRLGQIAPKTAAFLSNAPTKTQQIAKSALVGSAQGALYGAGSTDVTNGESRLEKGGSGAFVGGVVGGLGGALLGKKVSEGNNQLNKSLVLGTENTKQEIGDEVGKQILQSGNAAQLAKTKAYEISDAAAGNAYVENNHIRDLADAVDNALDEAKLNPRLIPAVGEIKAATKALKSDASSPQNLATSYARVNDFIKELRAMPYSAENYPAIAKAKEVFGNYMKDWIESGKIKEFEGAQKLIGEGGTQKSVIDLIKDANSKNITWKQNFAGKDANKTIRDYVSSQGESLTPENLVDKLTSHSQSGFDAITAAKKALGEKIVPVLKEGFINKIKAHATDASGNVNPEKLAKAINDLLKNKSLAEQVFSASEIEDLAKMANQALNVKTGGIVEKAIVGVGKRVPLIGGMVEHAADAAKQSKIQKQLLKSGTSVRYKTLFGLGSK